MIQYTIHEVAALLNISTDAIRLYEKEGLVTPTRNPENGYRYYDTEQIHRIMGICLYRKLNVSIAEIKRLLAVSTLGDLSESFSGFIDSRKKEIGRLTLEVEKMSYMKQHLDTLDEGSRTISIRTLPAVYPLYHQDSAFLGYRTLKDVFHSPLFSMGNFSYILFRGTVRFLPGQRLPVCHPRADACTHQAQFHQSAQPGQLPLSPTP